MRFNNPFTTILFVALACSLLLSCAHGQLMFQWHQSLSDHRWKEWVSDPFHVFASDDPFLVEDTTLLGIGCTPVTSLHKSIKQGANETMVTFSVQSHCGSSRPASQGLHSIRLTVDADEGELDVYASIADGVEDELAERIALTRLADMDQISSTYDEATRLLTVKIPHKLAQKQDVPLTVVPKPSQPSPSTHMKPGNDESQSPEIKTQRDSGRQSDSTPSQASTEIHEQDLSEEIRRSIQALEEELAKIKNLSNQGNR
jgi:hypothetical protein